MFDKSIQSSIGEPSFFYLIMGAACFRRVAATHHPHASAALRHIGRGYLAKASRVAPMQVGSPSAIKG